MKPGIERQLAITSRILAGALGGYALTSLIVAALFLLLRSQGVSRDEALLAPTLVSFLIYAKIVMAVFQTRSVTRAWLWLICASIPLGLLLILLLYGDSGA